MLVARERLHDALGRLAGHEASLTLLLHLFAADDADEGISTGLLCASVSAPRTTVLRWVTGLLEAGLVWQGRHQADGRVKLVRLAPAVRAALLRYLVAISPST